MGLGSTSWNHMSPAWVVWGECDRWHATPQPTSCVGLQPLKGEGSPGSPGCSWGWCSRMEAEHLGGRLASTDPTGVQLEGDGKASAGQCGASGHIRLQTQTSMSSPGIRVPLLSSSHAASLSWPGVLSGQEWGACPCCWAHPTAAATPEASKGKERCPPRWLFLDPARTAGLS